MALPYPIPDPATGEWDPFALKQNLDYLDRRTPPRNTVSPGIYYNFSTGASTGANTDETTAGTFTLPSDTLDSVDDLLLVQVTFRTAANANTKRFRVYWGSTAGVDTGAVAMNNQMGAILLWIGVATATVQRLLGFTQWSTAGTAGTPVALTQVSTPSEILTNPLAVTITMLNGSASAGDCVVNGALAVVYQARI